MYTILQVIWGKRLILFPPLSIIYKVERRLSYLLEIFLMLIGTSTMMLVYGGIHGDDLLKGVQHIIHGYGLLEITK